MPRLAPRSLVAVLALLLSGAAAPSSAQQPGAARWFGNLTLTDQNGERLRLYEDLMAGQIVVVNAFYTSCRASCPLVMGTLSHLRARSLADGLTVRFISITVDPEHDTPERLELYAQTLEANADWNMLSGDPATVRQALHRLGLDTDPESPADHLNVLYMGNLRTGLWKKVFSLAPLDDLERSLQGVVADHAP